MVKVNNKHIGSSFDEFLKEDGIFEEVTAQSIKRVIAWQLEEEMSQKAVSKKEMASRMGTSRSQLDRILDPENTKLQLETLYKAASALGRTIRFELV